MKQKSIFQTGMCLGIAFLSVGNAKAQQTLANADPSSHGIVNAAKIPVDPNISASRVYTYPWLFAPNSYRSSLKTKKSN